VGDVLDIRPVASARGGNAEIARVIREDLEQRQGLLLDSNARLAVETAIDVADALLGPRFLAQRPRGNLPDRRSKARFHACRQWGYSLSAASSMCG